MRHNNLCGPNFTQFWPSTQVDKNCHINTFYSLFMWPFDFLLSTSSCPHNWMTLDVLNWQKVKCLVIVFYVTIICRNDEFSSTMSWVFFFILFAENSQILLKITHTAYSRNNMRQKCEGNCGLWVLNEMIKEIYPEHLKKNRGCLLNSTANPAQFEWKWAELAMLFSR